MSKIVFSFTIDDADDDSFTMRIFADIDSSTQLDDLDSYSHAIWNAVFNLVLGSLSKAEVQFLPDISGWSNQVYASSDVEEQAFLTLGTVNPNWNSFLTIPTIEESFFTDNGAGKELDVTQSSVTAFYTILTENINNGGYNVTDSHGVDITHIVKAIQRFNSGRGGR